jgi:cation transport regulator ChaB
MFAAFDWWKDQERHTRKMEREERAEQVARDTHV